MNIADSQRLETKLNELGYKSASEKEADLIIVNSCSVRQHAVDRIWGGIKKWKNLGKKIFITGCVVASDQKKLASKDIGYFPIKDLINLGKILGGKDQEIQHYLSIKPNLAGNDDLLDYQSTKSPIHKLAHVPIMTGCNNFCTYCAVPYTRGREISRPIDEIIVEIEEALHKGFKEVLLLGQNVNSYTSQKSVKSKVDNNDFTELLKQVDNLDGDFTFNFMSSNPHDMGPELVKCFSELKKWPRELHLAMQSGDDDILRKMNRKIDSKQFLDLVSHLKLEIRNLKLSTDIIVGFPGESEEQFENTVNICKKINFEKAYISQYSPRAGTVSAKMADDVSKEEKKRRWLVLDNLINHKK